MIDASLRSAFEQLMSRAPAPIFPKARQLYLHKYSLDSQAESSELKLFIKEERIEELIEEPIENQNQENPPPRIAVLLIRPISFALVHWQRAEPARDELVRNYLNERWGLTNKGLTPEPTPWFKNGGHQSLLPTPAELYWRRESVLSTLRNEKL
ncbi:MAG: hypothetical protein AB8E87_08340 [Prochlorococcus sp.]|jgi:hypothetical protein